MIKKAIFIFFSSFLLLLSLIPLFGDNRVDNIEIYVVLDKSLSMVEEIDSVKKYILTEILDKIVINGDYFTLIPFYGESSASFNGYINSNIEFQDLKEKIETIEADGRFTDIGNALETLRTNINKTNNSTRKYMLLITDGKQEAPPESPFYSPDGSFNHEFLKNTKEIRKSGWKVIVLGIGTDSAAKEIAQRLSAGYSVIKNNISSDKIESTMDNFLGNLILEDFPEKLTVDNEGNSILTIQITSDGYENREKVNIVEIQFISDNIPSINILENPFVFDVDPIGSSEIAIPVTLPIIDENSYKGDIIFIFGGENAFTPAIKPIMIETKGSYSKYIVIISLIVLLFVIIFYTLRIIRRKRMEDNGNANEPI